MSVRQAKLCDYNRNDRRDSPVLLCENLAVSVCMICDKDTCEVHTKVNVLLMFARQYKASDAAVASHVEIASAVKATGVLCQDCARFAVTLDAEVRVALQDALAELQTKIRAKLAAGALG